ncbi:MAG: Rrf2 family transcriptional regulator [Cyanobacteria bacterium P01_A01_bin.135]
MQLSTKSEYALLALLELAGHYATGEPLQIRQIAADQAIPDRYLEQLLATLRRSGLVRSQRGAKGGYLLAREPWNISLLEVLSSVEGLGTQAPLPPTASLSSLVVHGVWREAQEAADTVLKGYTLQDLATQREAKQQADIMYYI